MRRTRQLIVEVLDAGQVFSRPSGFPALEDGSDGPAQDHVAVLVDLHGDLVGMDTGVVCERLHDRLLERLIGHASTHARGRARAS
jgi:hypothetical protein